MLVCISEEHHVALRFIHRAIKRNIVAFDEKHLLVHLDAHPDLSAAETMPAQMCFEPRELYDFLASDDGGIASWILPLAYEGHCDRVWWLKPVYAEQIPIGHYEGHVGEDTNGNLRVDFPLLYYIEDGLYCKDVQNSRELKLSVDTQYPDVAAGPWILDICLDYFVTKNPFAEQLPAPLVAAVQNAFKRLPFRRKQMDPVEVAAVSDETEDRWKRSLEEGIWTKAVDSLHIDVPEDRELLLSFQPSAVMMSRLADAGDLIQLPLTPTDAPDTTILQFRALETFLRNQPPPKMVTIARSVVDGYTPMRAAIQLEREILLLLERVYGSVDLLFSDELE